MSAPPAGKETIGFGVVGLGFMGRTHLSAWRDAGAALRAVCDRSPEHLSGRGTSAGNIGPASSEPLFDPTRITATDDLDTFLAPPGLDVVSICTPTDTHVPLAERVMQAGKHVLIEKPVAIDLESFDRLERTATETGVLCMPAMCMRFWPAWAWTRAAIAEQRFGLVRAARFERLGTMPTWGEGFYADTARSGGALFDLHVHDTDFVVHCFGLPHAVTTTGDLAHATTLYHYPSAGPHQVCAQGGWVRGETFGFRMRMLIECEHATIDFELGREHELEVHLETGTCETPALDTRTGWAGEVRALADAIGRADGQPPATLASARDATRVLIAERESLNTGEMVSLERIGYNVA